GAKEPEAITLKYGDAITEPTVEIPDGYTLTWTGIPEGGKMGLEAVTLTGTWAKKTNTVTYVYAGEKPDGAKEPEAITLKYGDAITEPTVEIPDGYTLTWTGIPEGGKMGLEAVTLTGTWAKESYTITYYLTDADKAEGKVYTTETVKYGDALPVVTPEAEGKTFNHWDYETEAGVYEDDFDTMPAYNLVAVANLSDIVYTVIFTNVWGDEVTVEKAYGTSLEEADIPDLTDGENVNVVLTYDSKPLAEQLPLALTEDITIDCAFNVTATFYTVYDEENPENNVVHKAYTFDLEYVTKEADFADLGVPYKKGHSLDTDLPWTWEYIDQTMLENTYFVANFVANDYTATFTAGEGAFAEGTVTTVEVTFGEEIEFTAEPKREGYTFKGWTDVEGGEALKELVMDAEGKTFYPVFKMNGTADFSVELYLMNKEGKYDATPTKILPESGLVGVTAKANHGGCQQYIDDWFSADTSEEAGNVYEGVIAEDGSTVLKLYYKRAEYDVVIDGAEAVKVFHGATVTAPTESANAPAGYTLASWNDGAYTKGQEITVTGPLTLTPDFAAGTSSYTINTYTMGLDGEYGEAKSETKTYTTDETVTYTAPVVEGFKADKDSYSVVVTGDNKAEINVYYVRNKYDVTIDGVTTPTFHGAEVTAPETSTATPAGYVLESWNDGAYAKGEVITVTGPLTLAPKFAAGTSEYTINIYEMGLDGEYGAAVSSETKEYTTDETVTYTAPVVEGFKADKESYSVVVTGDNKAEINVYYAREQYDVVINGVSSKAYYGATITAPTEAANAPAGYHLASWNNGAVALGQEIEVTGPVTLEPKFEANTDTAYTVEIYLMDEYGKYAETADDTDSKTGTTDTIATAAHADYAQEAWFTPAATGNVTEAPITGDGKAVLKLYFERAQYDVTIDGVTTPVYHGATINAPATTTQTAPAGFAFAGWNNGTIAAGAPITVTGPVTLEPYFIEGAANYTVEIYLQNADGTYAEAASDTETGTGKTGDEVTIAHADYAQADYYLADDAQANKLTGTIAGDGSLVLKLYFKRATYDIVVDGEVVAEDVIHGAEITLPEESDNITEGNELAGWTDGKNTYEPGETIIVDGPIDLEPIEKPSDATKYTISIYVMDVNGEYVGTSTVAYGTTGATQTIVADYGRTGFTVDTAKSNLADIIAGDGSTVLSVYYARNLYNVTFDGVPVEGGVYYGASIPAVEPAAREGQEFDKWTPEVPASMPAEDLEFTSTWTDVMYKLVYIINGTEEEYEYAAGAVVTPIEDPEVPGMTFIKWNKIVPTVMPAEDVYIVAEFEAAVFKVTFVDGDGNVFDEKAVKYGDAIVLPATNPTKEYHVFKGWLDVPEKMGTADITIYPDFERVPVRLVAAEGSTTVIDRETMIITGLTTRMNDAKKDKYLAVEGDGYYTITPAAGYEGYDCYGTGTVVKVYDNADTSAPIEEFYIVIYGDVNGDSAVNSLDGSIIEDETLYVTNWSRGDSKDILMVMAADLNKDGKIRPNDKDSVINTSIGITKIDQVTGTVSR
ncbi:MAG: InlB B-repeat-containing protein, partial [Clostridia bacterium]|nr:InlB B-repeat-containing protein [Clostridia bacterium]